MDPKKLVSALLTAWNDDTNVSAYGHGWLVTTPLSFYDDDRVTVFVEPFKQGCRVSDHGTTAMRLLMADVNPDSPRIAESRRRSNMSLRTSSDCGDEGVIAACGSWEDLGDLILRVAEAMIRVDQFRFLIPEKRTSRFTERVIGRLRDSVPSTVSVTPRAPLRLASGRVKQVTASVDVDKKRLYVQAVSNATRETRDRSVEHCAYLFTLADEISRDHRLVVASGRRRDWPDDVIGELTTISEIAFFDDAADVKDRLVARCQAISAASSRPDIHPLRET